MIDKNHLIRCRFIFSEHSDRLFESCDGTVLLDDKILVMGSTFESVVTLRRLSTVSYVYDPDDITATQWTWYWMDEHGYWREYDLDHRVSCYPILHQEKRQRLYDHCSLDNKFSEASCAEIIGTFRSDYEYEYEYEFFNVYPVRMPDCVRLSRQLVWSSKSRRRLDANYEIFNKSRTRLRVLYRCKGELKG